MGSSQREWQLQESILQWPLAGRPGMEVWSQRWKTTIGTHKSFLGTLCSSFKGPGHMRSYRVGSHIFAVYL